MKRNTFHEGLAAMWALSLLQLGQLDRNSSLTPVTDALLDCRRALGGDISRETFKGLIRFVAEIEVAAQAARVRSTVLARIATAPKEPELEGAPVIPKPSTAGGKARNLPTARPKRRSQGAL